MVQFIDKIINEVEHIFVKLSQEEDNNCLVSYTL